MTSIPHFVGLDVGGTTMKAAVVDDNGKAYPHVVMNTESPRGQEAGLETMCECIRRAVTAAGLQMSDIAAIGVATPGTMDIAAGLILDPPNLKPWRNVPVRDHIKGVFKIPIAFQNDANAAAFGEYWIGAGRGFRSMVMFTLGTGIGGGIIIAGNILEGEHSHGGEIGHTRIEISHGRLCGCGRYGCLEAYGSGTSVVKRTLEALEADGGKSSLHAKLASSGKPLTAKVVFEASDEGDELAMKIAEDTAFYLGVGAQNMMHTIDPDLILFGGGMAAGDKFLARIRHWVKELAFPIPASKAQVKFAELGSDAGIIGSAACGRQLYHAGKK